MLFYFFWIWISGNWYIYLHCDTVSQLSVHCSCYWISSAFFILLVQVVAHVTEKDSLCLLCLWSPEIMLFSHNEVKSTWQKMMTNWSHQRRSSSASHNCLMGGPCVCPKVTLTGCTTSTRWLVQHHGNFLVWLNQTHYRCASLTVHIYHQMLLPFC